MEKKEYLEPKLAVVTIEDKEALMAASEIGQDGDDAELGSKSTSGLDWDN